MNPKLGDVGFKHAGKSYILNMGVNALCLVEHATDAPATDVVQRMVSGPRVSDIRLLFWAGLQRHHPGLDLDAAGDMVQAMNKAKDAARKPYELILESMQLCSPDPDDAEAAEGDLDPPEDPAAIAAGTGTPSS